MHPIQPTQTSAPSRLAWLEVLGANFDRAATTCDQYAERWFSIGGVRFKLCFAGTTITQIVSSAFEHLRVADDGNPAAITINIYDQRDSSLSLPSAPGNPEDFSPRGDIRNFNTAQIKIAFQPFGKILTAYDTTRRHGVVSYGDPHGIYNFERATPLRGLLNWCLRPFEVQLLHAGAVACEQGGVLLGGKGGAGKSNTALACLRSGMSFLSDDFCAVASKPVPTVYSLYSTARTRTGDWARLPFLELLADRQEQLPQDKELYYLRPAFAQHLIMHSPLRAILLPTVYARRPLEITPASPREALLALAPVTTSLLPDAGTEILANLSTLIRQLPCYRLYLGPDINAIPEAIHNLLRDIPRS